MASNQLARTHVPTEPTRENDPHRAPVGAAVSRAERRRVKRAEVRAATRQPVRDPRRIHYWVTLQGGRSTTLCGDERQCHDCRGEDGEWLRVDFDAAAFCPGCGAPLCPTCRAAFLAAG